MKKSPSPERAEKHVTQAVTFEDRRAAGADHATDAILAFFGG